MTTRDQQIEILRTNALMEALGSALGLADPDNPGVQLFLDPAKDREAREAVSTYLHSWVIGPLAHALLKRELGAWQNTTQDSGRAEAYLDEVRELLSH